MPSTFLIPPNSRELADVFTDLLKAEMSFDRFTFHANEQWRLVKMRKDGSVISEAIPLHRVYRDPWDTRNPEYNDRSRDTAGMRWISIDEALGNTPGNLKLSVLAVRWAWRIKNA